METKQKSMRREAATFLTQVWHRQSKRSASGVLAHED